MAEQNEQSFDNHTRWDPLFHYVTVPIFVLLPIGTAIHFIWRPSLHLGVIFVISVAAAIAIFKIRLYSLKVQDRVIRLEERQRLALLMAEPLRFRIPELTEAQLIGLRFASDAEVAKLAERALAEKLSQADIKKAIQTWRPDNFRV